MSDEYYDEDMMDAYEPDPDELSPEDVIGMVTINKHKMTRVHVSLRDEHDDEVELADVIVELLKYLKDKMEDESGDNQFMNQILPLVAQSMASGLARSMGIDRTAFLLSQEVSRAALVNMMSLSFLMLKFLQEKELQVYTHEEDVSVEEVEEIERKSRANSIATMASLMGDNPVDILKRLKDEGKLTKEDLAEMLGTEVEDDEDDCN